MKLAKLKIESLLLEIRGQITGLNVEEDFKHTILENFELAAECFKEKNILGALNCLAVLAGQLQTHAIFSHCRDLLIEKLLISVHHLQQILARLPVRAIGSPGTTGPVEAPEPMKPVAEIGANDPAGTAKTATVISTSYPISRFPIPEIVATQSGFFDFSTHIVTYCNPYRKR